MTASRQANNDNLENFDCCGILKYIASFSIFQPDYSSAAERGGIVASLTTPYDKSIHDLIGKADFRYSLYAEYNPLLSQQKPITHANELLRNAYLRSRLFVKNAKQQGLSVSSKDKIFILDVGCENALSLAGIIAYFGKDKIQYVGIDNNELSIQQCKNIYADFENVEFIHADGRQYLNDHQGMFDVILFQHPNLSSPDPRVIMSFKNMLIAAQHSLRDHGLLYLTFYYDCEVTLFNEAIKQQIALGFESEPVCTHQFKSPILVDRRFVVGSSSSEPYVSFSPENYVLTSLPKPQLQNMKKFN